MKKILLCLTILLYAVALFSQAPQAFNYQAILRNTDGSIREIETISLQISIVDEQGNSVYTEIHDTTTNDYGLVNVIIGKGSTSDDLADVNWANGPYYLEITVNGEYLGSNSLISVPYALFAETAQEFSEIDPRFDTSLAAGITVMDTTRWNNKLATEVDGDTTNEIQNLAEVIALNNSANGQIKDLVDPIDAQDAVTKTYVDDLRKVLYQVLDPADLLAAGAKVIDLFEAGVMVGTLEQLGVDSMELANAGLIGSVTDYDGNIYKWVRIGDQVWMAENLKVTHFNDGTPIDTGIEYSFNGYILETCLISNSYYSCVWYDFDESNLSLFGALYNHTSVLKDNLCPEGWRVSTDGDWYLLEDYLGGRSLAGGKLKSIGYWTEPNLGATNETGFSALPGGMVGYTGNVGFAVCGGFFGLNEQAKFWSPHNQMYPPPSRYIYYDRIDIQYQESRCCIEGPVNFSVRCVKDSQ